MSTLPAHQSEPCPSALSHACPFCGAGVGQDCITKTGRPTQWPHRRRELIADPPDPVAVPVRQALCCECGALRDYRIARNHRGYFGADPDWHRNLCDLKCAECNTITTHASVGAHGGDDRGEQIALRRVSTDEGWTENELARYAQLYRRGNLPRNPYLHHWHWMGPAREAWAAGRREVIAVCGATMPLRRDPDGPSARDDTPADELYAPSDVRDQEYEDPDTGLWWIEMECVDCLRVANDARRQELLDAVRRQIIEITDATPSNSWTLDEIRIVRDALLTVVNSRTKK